MKVLVASTTVPFVDSGGIQIVDWTVEALRSRGFEAEALFIPFADDREVVLAQTLALRTLDLTDYCDVLVPVRWPAHVIRHPRKRPWFIHHLRLFMDLWNWESNPIPHTPETIALREVLRDLDTAALSECERIFTNSAVMSQRVKEFNELDSTVLYPPLRDGQPAPGNVTFESFVFYPSRVNRAKRQLLALEGAMQTSNTRILIAGVCDDAEYREELLALQAQEPERLDVRLGWMSDADKQDLLARCSAVLYIPFDEDSYGYPTLESYRYGKPVISCTDSGGTREIIEDQVTGRLVSPSATDLGAAMEEYVTSSSLAARHGAAGRQRIDLLGINWDDVVGHLTGALS